MDQTLNEKLRSLSTTDHGVPVYPYVAAVTGHLCFDEKISEEKIQQAFSSVLEEAVQKWSDACGDCNAPFILMSGLADGADQLAVEAALNLAKEKGLNIKILAVLPMEWEYYKLTIQNQERAQRLLDQSLSYALPLLPQNLEHVEDLKRVEDYAAECYRQAQYQQQAAFLALHSHVLFAFWDGVDAQKPGGTSEVIHIKLEGKTDYMKKQTIGPSVVADAEENAVVKNTADLLTYSSVGPVIHFLIPRPSSNEENQPPIEELPNGDIPIFLWRHCDLWDTVRKIHTFPDRARMNEAIVKCREMGYSQADVDYILNDNDKLDRLEVLDDVMENIGLLNQDFLKHSKSQTAQQEANVHCSEILQGYEDLVQSDAGLKMLDQYYKATDQMSAYFKKKMNDSVAWHLWFLALMIFFGSIGTTVTSLYTNARIQLHCQTIMFWQILNWSVFALYAFFTVMLFFSFVKSWSNRFNYHYQYHRAMAENLRAQIFWRIARITDSMSECYRTHQMEDTEWLRAAMNSLNVLMAPPKPFELDSDSGKQNFKKNLNCVYDQWVSNQLAYFQKTCRDRKERSKGRFLKWTENNRFCSNLMAKIRFILKWMVKKRIFPRLMAKKQAILGVVLFFAIFSIVTIQACNVNIYMLLHHLGWLNYIPIWLKLSFCAGASFFLAFSVSSDLSKSIRRISAEAKRYEEMTFPFSRAFLLLQPLKDMPTEKITPDMVRFSQSILYQLGMEAVTENAEWLQAVCERDLKFSRQLY